MPKVGYRDPSSDWKDEGHGPCGAGRPRLPMAASRPLTASPSNRDHWSGRFGGEEMIRSSWWFNRDRRVFMVLAGLVFLALVGYSGAESLAASPKGFCQPLSASEVLATVGDRSVGRDQTRLVPSQVRVRPGQAVQARLVNPTPNAVSYGAEFLIQHYGPAGWTLDESSPDRLWPRRARKLHPGRAGRCYRYTVPADQRSGRYRFLTWTREGSKKKRRVAEFRVTGG